MKDKICFIVPLPASAKWFFLDHMRALQADYEVHLCADFCTPKDYEPFDGIICHNCNLERRISPSRDIKSVIELVKLFKTEGFVSVHSMSAKIGLLAAVASKLAGVRHRIHIFTGQVWATQTGMKRRIFKMLDKLIVLLDTNLLTDGFSQRQFLIDEKVVTENNCTVLANGSITGVNVERFCPSADVKKRERDKFNLSDNKVVYLFLGRLKREKGIEELFAAFNRMVSECPDAVLLLYGADEEKYDGRIRNYPNMKRGDNYIYAGYTNKPEESVQVGDVFCLPTYREGFGSSVIEASSLGIPVITSDAYGVMDASIDGVTGKRCKVKDVDTLLENMKFYYNNPELRIHHGMNGRQMVMEKFNNKAVTKAWVEYYHKVIG